MDTTTDFFERMFSCEGWDQLDTFDFVFYDCTLNRDIGDFKEGTKIDAILSFLVSARSNLRHSLRTRMAWMKKKSFIPQRLCPLWSNGLKNY